MGTPSGTTREVRPDGGGPIDGRDRRAPAVGVEPGQGALPGAGFTKGEIIDYYARIAPVMLPHLATGRSRSSASRTASTPRVLREERAQGHARLGTDGPAAGAGQQQGPRRARLRRRRRPADAGLGRPTSRRSRCTSRSGRSDRAARVRDPDLLVVDLDPGAPADVAGLRRGRRCCVREYLRGRRPDLLREDERLEGNAGLRLDHARQ